MGVSLALMIRPSERKEDFLQVYRRRIAPAISYDAIVHDQIIARHQSQDTPAPQPGSFPGCRCRSVCRAFSSRIQVIARIATRESFPALLCHSLPQCRQQTVSRPLRCNNKKADSANGEVARRAFPASPEPDRRNRRATRRSFAGALHLNAYALINGKAHRLSALAIQMRTNRKEANLALSPSHHTALFVIAASPIRK